MLTANQEKFAQLVSSGVSQTDAYLSAYPRTKDRKVASKKGSELVRNGGVKVRILELKKESAILSADDPETMRDFIIQRYKEIASGKLCNVKEVRDGKGKLIKVEKSISPSDVVNAIKALAEIYGLELTSNDNEVHVVFDDEIKEYLV